MQWHNGAMSGERLERSLDIDKASAAEIVEIIQEQDTLIAAAVARESSRISRAMEAIVDRLSAGGRLIYVGAGTSGRIAMLDASELPPTYGIESGRVEVLMAGGERAFLHAAEGAEDDQEAAVRDVNRAVTPEDAVIGVAASGTTPYTVAAVRRANMLGALTIGITSVAQSPLAREVDIPIVVETGPEVIMGSSRMKSGTAQKLVLNTISTGTMILLGRVYSNLMIDMPVTNEKLARRAIRMVELAAGVPAMKARQALEGSGNRVRIAAVMARYDLTAEEAEARLNAATGSLREVLGA